MTVVAPSVELLETEIDQREHPELVVGGGFDIAESERLASEGALEKISHEAGVPEVLVARDALEILAERIVCARLEQAAVGRAHLVEDVQELGGGIATRSAGAPRTPAAPSFGSSRRTSEKRAGDSPNGYGRMRTCHAPSGVSS